MTAGAGAESGVKKRTLRWPPITPGLVVTRDDTWGMVMARHDARLNQMTGTYDPAVDVLWEGETLERGMFLADFRMMDFGTPGRFARTQQRFSRWDSQQKMHSGQSVRLSLTDAETGREVVMRATQMDGDMGGLALTLIAWRIHCLPAEGEGEQEVSAPPITRRPARLRLRRPARGGWLARRWVFAYGRWGLPQTRWAARLRLVQSTP